MRAQCQCGLSYVPESPEDERMHRRVHEEFRLGPRAKILEHAPTVGEVGGLRMVRISDDLTRRIRDSAARLALVAHRSTPDQKAGYDGSVTGATQRVYAVLRDGRAPGFVLVGETTRSWRLRWTELGCAILTDEAADQSRRLVIARVWLAESLRGRGLGQALVTRVAQVEDRALADLTFQLPLSSSGSVLVKRLLPGAWFGDGDLMDLEVVLCQP